MNQIRTKLNIKRWAAGLGILLFVFSLLPTVLLGDRAYVIAHDQLDGEVLAYILNAKHVGEDSFPEFLNGTNNRESLTPASYGTLLFYMMVKPAMAFMLNETFIRITAFVGMFLLLRKWSVRSGIAYMAAFLFSLLDFYSVYGLSVMGQPLLLYAYLEAKDCKHGIIPYCIAFLFACFSSPILVGYADIIILCVMMLVSVLKKKTGVRETGAFLLVLLITYCILYRQLFIQVLGGAAFISHRSEWKLNPEGSWITVFWSMFWNGLYHAEANQSVLIVWVVAVIGIGMGLFHLWGTEEKQTYRRLRIMFVGILIVSAIYATWRTEPMISLRQKMGGLFVSFNLQRFFWLNPLLWWTAFGLTAHLIIDTTQLSWMKESKCKTFIQLLSSVLALVFMMSVAVNVFTNSPLKENMMRLIRGTKETDASFGTFFSEDLFGKIEKYIDEPKESYKVGSVGLYPSIPLYNGFYCIDGYSNNYDVEYKHTFRATISEELDRNETIRTYFDEWGNRCYLFSAELGKKYRFTKAKPKEISEFHINTDELRKQKCSYIISGVRIRNAEETGLQFLRIFEDKDSPYQIWLYHVAENERIEE